MGMEYAIRFAAPKRAPVEDILGRLGAQLENGPSGACYVFRSDPSSKGMPNATAMLEDGGLYFCDHGGGKEYLGRLVTALVEEFAPVTIRDYEE
jgi:hypothetical protein